MLFEQVHVVSFRQPLTASGKRYNDYFVVIGYGSRPKVITEIKIAHSADESRRKKIICEATRPSRMPQTLGLGIQGVLIGGNPSFLQDSVPFILTEMNPESFRKLAAEKGLKVGAA